MKYSIYTILYSLQEVNRTLKSGGIFAAIDCDWPPVTKWEAGRAYMRLYDKIKEIEADVPEVRDSFTRYPKKTSGKHCQKRMLFICAGDSVLQYGNLHQVTILQYYFKPRKYADHTEKMPRAHRKSA